MNQRGCDQMVNELICLRLLWDNMLQAGHEFNHNKQLTNGCLCSQSVNNLLPIDSLSFFFLHHQQSTIQYLIYSSDIQLRFLHSDLCFITIS
ncbi:hypothetical protein QVD17_05244 [Tagetes erecta]|uniref:Uncharacterized protein n=1 Tax=Tagetes erecta TaxID=13708 RepID=A0AAD8PBC2_TARER|nr:hypothetical protein QVD17_05244 [Tagetes erecta]